VSGDVTRVTGKRKTWEGPDKFAATIEQARKEGRHTWEQLEGEPVDAYDHFKAYRDLGSERNLAKAYAIVRERSGNPIGPDENKQPSGRVTMYSHQYGWVERAADFDAFLRRMVDMSGIAAMESVAEREAKFWRDAMEVRLKDQYELSQKILRLMGDRLDRALNPKSEKDRMDLTPSQMLSLLPAAYGLQAAALYQATGQYVQQATLPDPADKRDPVAQLEAAISPTPKSKGQHNDMDYLDPEDMTEEQLRAISGSAR
jgi:hypothetical protein